MRTPRHIDKVGVIGSLITAACCLGLPAVVSVVTAIGLGFLLDDAILAPLLGLFLLLTLWGLAAGWKRHGKPWPLGLGMAASLALVISIYARHSPPAAYAAVALLVLATVLNVLAARPRRPSPSVPSVRTEAT